jgi:sec-independent protein translocase protein TatA
MFGLSPVELIVIGSIAVLLFGSRLPSVARSMGKSVTEFKKGIRGIEEDMDVSTSGRRVSSSYADERDEPTVPKFQPPKSEPKDESARDESARDESPSSESASQNGSAGDSAGDHTSHDSSAHGEAA